MGNKQGKDRDENGKHLCLFDVNATGASVYPIALKEKDQETKAELFRHAGHCYREEKDSESAAKCFILSGEIYSKIDQLTEAADMYQAAMMEYSLLGPSKFDEFKDAADEALILVSRSKYETRQRACRDQIGQAVLRMLDKTTTENGLSLLIRSGLYNRYLKGDYYINGLRETIKKLKTLNVQDMLLWSLVFKTAVDYYTGLFILDNSIDEELGTYTSCAVLTAYLFSLQPPARRISVAGRKSIDTNANKSTQNDKTRTNKDDNDDDDDDDNLDNEEDIQDVHGHFYEQPPDYKALMKEFSSINVFKRVCHQACHNIITAAEAGDIEALNEQFHELYFTRRKNKFKLVEFIGEIFNERFTTYIKKGFVKEGKWDESSSILPENPTDENNTSKKDVVDDLL